MCVFRLTIVKQSVLRLLTKSIFNLEDELFYRLISTKLITFFVIRRQNRPRDGMERSLIVMGFL